MPEIQTIALIDGQVRPLPRPAFAAQTLQSAPAPTHGSATTLAGLGDPTQGGLWLRSGLVTQSRMARVTTREGRSLDLEVRPSGADPSAGSQISLAAMQALGLPLAALAELQVDLQ